MPAACLAITPRTRWALVVVAALLAPSASTAAPAASPGEPVRVVLQSPRPGEAVENRVHVAPVQGSAVSSGERPSRFDVMIVVDVSASTRCASGIDVNRDGQLGLNPQLELLPPGTYPEDSCNTDPGDSVLAAEVAGARRLLETLDAGRVRVGLITFSGDVDRETGKRLDPGQADAWLQVPLTEDYAQVSRALDDVLVRGPHGATNFSAGLRLAISELAGMSAARSVPRKDAKRIVLFLTDGTPTFPIGLAENSDPGDVEAAIQAALLAHQAGITVNTYAVGPDALTNPVAATEMARVTLGTFTPVKNAGDIVAVLQGVSFANIEDVVVTNLTTGDFSTDVRLEPDGSFSGFVPVREGRNRVRVTALATDGQRGSVEVDLDFKMAGLSDRELVRELERIRERNKQLELLVERKRIEEFRAREKQRKELQIE
ncbi:MAG: VWA domain-containing protein [Deltaproteobacteria bacterium]|nr:VWA domain-containing protein [Deltaproteobacteria bacterium]